MKDVKKWLNYHFSTGCETGEDYKKFEREMRSDLKRKAAGIGCVVDQFNKNHYEFSAVLRDEATGRYVYVSIPDVRFWPNEWYTHVLYRTMQNDHDWTGGNNHYCEWDELPDAVSELVRKDRLYMNAAG